LENRTLAERFAIPHAFTPNLSVSEAIVAALGAMTRIVLGSLLFAIWGVYSIRSFESIENHFWRAAVVAPLVLTFAVLFAALMIGISAVLKKVSPKRS
jgi:hypothetical protein